MRPTDLRKPSVPGPDAIIVGAGPAGTVTALLLARAGARVLLLDRHAFPRAKPCGDCLSAAGTTVLQRLGVLNDVRALPHARLHGWRIVAPAGTELECAFPDIGADHAISIERRFLDHALLEAASRAGAEFRAQAHVTEIIRDEAAHVRGVMLQDGTQLSSRVVIGADGLRSVIAARLGAVARAPKLRKLSLTFHLDERVDTRGFGEMHVAQDCCVGIAPVNGSGRTNVTVVAHVRMRADQPLDAHALARVVIDRMPALRGRIDLNALDRTRFMASGPFDRPMRAVVFDGAALVGDAAGYYDPFTGQGIYQGLISAEILAPVVLAAIATDDTSARALRPYARQRAAALRGTRPLQHVIEGVLSRPAIADVALARVRSAVPFANALLSATSDLTRPSSVFAPATLLSLATAGLRPVPPCRSY